MKYFILAASKSRAQLFFVDNDNITPLVVEGMPTSKEEAWKGLEREDGLRVSDSARNIEEQEEDRYMHMIAKSLEKTLHEAHLAVVFAGVQEEYGMFKKFDKSHMLAEKYIQGSPDKLDMQDLKEKADPIAKEYMMKRNEEFLEEFGNLQGTGRTSTDAEVIREAAQPGKVDLLLIADGAEDEANAIKMYVLQHHGRIAILEADKMPEGAKMAAILRF